MVEAGEADWSGEDMVVPRDLPINTGRLVSDIVLEDRGPYWDDPDPEVITYLDTSAFVKLVIDEDGAPTKLAPGSTKRGRPSPASSPTRRRAPHSGGARDSDARMIARLEAWLAALDARWSRAVPSEVDRACRAAGARRTGCAAWTPSSSPLPIRVRERLRARTSTDETSLFATFDRRLLEAAEREGFATLGGPLS